jgi:6-pyruvoyltetrahydropterin/6-carboxytetrahydropterin synthase
VWTISKRFTFEAAHHLPDHDGTCASLHGHSYVVIVECSGQLWESGAQRGMVTDYGTIRSTAQPIIDRYDHRLLNDFFDNPTAELIAKSIYDELKGKHLKLSAVTIKETDGTAARYSEG